MEKIIRVDVPSDSYLEITQKEWQGNYWETDEISMPIMSKVECSGIWKDEIVFNMEDDWTLRFPTEAFLELVRAMKFLAQDKKTSWWQDNRELQQNILMALGIYKGK